ncbi:MAG TPA: helix-turn-helix domain-containing GNAT family N-acetyltransferase [Candidatus Sulfotelmatobacter sp.]|nr:helix-turn-helix domain-containing GNAT family N-acetyltransferase [Candidatus Sulfotelmatobacter sp.]
MRTAGSRKTSPPGEGIRPDQIAAVRSFNRVVTRRIGALTDSFHGRGRPLSEARLLFEIGKAGADARDLRARMSLDSGYLSRLLRSLERQGLVKTQPAQHDARVTTASLTRAGARELDALNRLSERFATTLLARLGTSQRGRLVAAMADVERLMQAAAVEIAIANPNGSSARWCLDAYYRELAERFPVGYDPARGGVVPESFESPHGAFVLATLDARPVGCGALKLAGVAVGEIKRMWVDRSARGLGVGRRILDALEAHARAAGLHTLRLETNSVLTEAAALYERAGYRRVEAFDADPYADRWFAKDLAQGADQA